ncbi:hypothetical protein [Oleidesulfovibrio sp.]|uniref:hypothetical protein n=1 Tax=Oleidesulfovibrio sp. TaxID=2909707 RepID=UPI003A896E9B
MPEEQWVRVIVRSPDDEPVAYIVDNKQHFTKVNKEKDLPVEHVEVLRQNGFTVDELKSNG